MDVTGSTESLARNVFMYIGGLEKDRWRVKRSFAAVDPAASGTVSRTGALVALMALLFFPGWLAAADTAQQGGVSGQAETVDRAIPTQPLSLTDAINLALRQSPSILLAQKELQASEGIQIQTRAITIPRLGALGNFNAAQSSDIDVISIPFGTNGFTFGTDKNWVSQIRLAQSVYEGGRMLSSLRVARLLRERSLLDYQTTVANTALEVEIAYYNVLLATEQIAVREASIELLTQILGDATKRFNAGTLPKFNVLQAEVELANAQPDLIRTRNALRTTKNSLATLLGLDLQGQGEDIPLRLSGTLKVDPMVPDLGEAVRSAFENRTELKALTKTQALRKEEIINAKAGSKPSAQIFAGYDVHNSKLSSDLGDENHGWIAGAEVTWNIFDGFRTKGRVMEATARMEAAGIELDDAGRRIELEVRTAHSTFREAGEVLKSQEKVMEQAAEALRLARARSEAGTGTQLDVLSAQTALTDARTTQSRALREFAVARARLERAMGALTPTVNLGK